MKVLFLLGVCVTGLAGLGSRWLLQDESAHSSAPQTTHGDYPTDEVAANGVLEGARPEVKVRPEISGTVAAIHVRENDEVSKGALLAELHNEPHKHRVALTTAELARARAALEKLRNGARSEKRKAVAALEKARHALFLNAEADFKRADRLLPSRTVSRKEWDAQFFARERTKAQWDQAKAELDLIGLPARAEDLKAGEAEVAAAEARHRLAQAELAKTRLVAPGNGRILQVYLDPGEMAGPDSPQPVLIMADVSKRRVRAFVEELDATRIKAGHNAVVTVDGLPGKEFRGTVGMVVPRMGKRSLHSDAPGEYKDVYYREILIDLAGADELPLNLRVHTRIDTPSLPLQITSMEKSR